MLHRYIRIALLSLIATVSALHADDNEAVAEANQKFYKALNSMFEGELKPMTSVWSHKSDTTYMSPDGAYVVGWETIHQDWKKQAAMKLGGVVEPTNVHIIVGEELAIVQNYEVGKNFDNEGKAVVVKIRATNVYRLEDGDWKMVSHHVDPLPELMKQQ